MFETEVDTVEELLARIIIAFDEIRENFNVQLIAESMIKRCHACIRAGGAHFEQFL